MCTSTVEVVRFGGLAHDWNTMGLLADGPPSGMARSVSLVTEQPGTTVNAKVVVTVVGYGVGGVAVAVMVNVAGPSAATSVLDSTSVDDSPATVPADGLIDIAKRGAATGRTANIWLPPAEIWVAPTSRPRPRPR
jgi:hypothetical protein